MSSLGSLRPALAALLAALLVLPFPAPVEAQRSGGTQDGAAATTRIMLLGDSVTQGSAGDWTWRYRLWRYLVDAWVPADLVGPRSDLAGAAPQSYADPDFDRDHASRWGMFATEGEAAVPGLMRDHLPDVLVVALGVNDLLWPPPSGADRTAAEVAGTLGSLVRRAQAVHPGVDVVLSEVTQTWFTSDGRPARLNDLLPGLAESLTTAESSVVVAHSAAGYTAAHTYDGSHPDPTGELRIAASVADALARLGVGEPPQRPLGSAPAVPRQVPGLRAVPRNGKVRLRWTPPPGATHLWVSLRDRTAREAWRTLPYPVDVEQTGMVVVPLLNYHRYQFRVNAKKGAMTVDDVFSPVVAATPRRPAPGAIAGVRRSARARSAALAWRPAVRATSYRITWAPRGRPAQVRRREVGLPAVRLSGLRPGQRYVVTLRALNDRTAGPVTMVAVRTRR